MPSPIRPSTLQRAKHATSWLALMAATTLGVTASAVEAEIRAGVEAPARGTLRLVVQVFGDDTKQPTSATQRVVTADEIRRGVRVDVVELSGEQTSRVFAWVEEGAADLEFDGRTARPGERSLVGESSTDPQGRVSIVLG